MAENIKIDPIVVMVAEDEMSAFLYLNPPMDGLVYTVGDLIKALEEKKVVAGVSKEVLRTMLEKRRYGRDILVAKGIEAVDGTNGNYEFFFSQEVKNRPKILADGSVDYSSLGEVEVVKENSVIAKYSPATKGKNGITVRGRVLISKPGRELQSLKGKGFLISDDKRTYTAAMTGKVEYDGESRLVISNLYVVNGDVNHVTGNVQFIGDIHVKGSVFTGTMVKASGQITVDGHVEAAHLIAGKDVILKNGMQGGGKGIIEANGNVSGKFFEQVMIKAKGSVNANAIMNCDIQSDENILVSGKLGVIVGGSVTAMSMIEATLIGNMTEVRTRIKLGVDKDLFAELSKLENDMKQLSLEVNKLSAGIEQVDDIFKKTGREDLRTKKVQLVRAKIEKDSSLSVLAEKKNSLIVQMEKSIRCKLVVHKSVYPGTMIQINSGSTLLESENYNITYLNKGVDIVFTPNI